jgi:plastocyanin
MGRRIAGVSITVLALLAMSLPAHGAFLVRATDGLRFRPRVADVATGTRVVWRSGTLTHTVTAYRGDWSKRTAIGPGERTRFRFTEPGTYRYRCRFHSDLVSGTCSGMCGVVVVG